MLPGTELAAVWPAAGVTVLWLLVRRAGPLSIDTALLGGAMSPWASRPGCRCGWRSSLPVTHLLQTVIVVELMRRALPELWGCGGTEALDSPRLLAGYLACVAAGVLVSTVVGMSWWRLVGEDADLALACSGSGATSAASSWWPPRCCCSCSTSTSRPHAAPVGGQQARVRGRLCHQCRAVRPGVPR